MGERKCEWVFLPARDDKIEGACGASVDGDSRYCALHQEEILTFIASDVTTLSEAICIVAVIPEWPSCGQRVRWFDYWYNSAD
jgi:hypothetical protein